MRKPRDFDAELKALGTKAKLLKEQRVRQLGELIIATGADAMPLEQLAGALLSAAKTEEQSTKEGWHGRGAAFFQDARKARSGADGNGRGNPATDRSAAPPASGDRS
ncbi:conjugal transfer protein TraD [Sphingomonas sp. PB4P5]|uniref:conjugal transfer protein TraD n=1 Tax=Parasphingomonas puruogangriensis TaxID=3096155 RepID=UPI002FC98A64